MAGNQKGGLDNDWWADCLRSLQLRHALPRGDVRAAWNQLWDEWARLDVHALGNRFLPEKARFALAFRRINPLALMIAPTFLTGLAAKGITPDELAGLVDSFLDHGWFREYESFELPDHDTVYSNGFGGDDIKTINVSTGAMIVASAAGVPCYKMGSRTYFSHTGSHNFLDVVGVRVSTTPEHAMQTLRTVGLAYIDGVATADPATQAIGTGLSVMPGARELMKTMSFPFRFPILCLNPMRPRLSVRGVSTLDTETPAEVLRSYYPYSRRFEIVAGTVRNGGIIDEVSNVGPTQITELRDGELRTFTTSPDEWGVREALPHEIRANELWAAAMKLVAILRGTCQDAHRDLVLVNASQILYVAGRVASRKQGTELAQSIIEDGRAIEKLREWVTASGGKRAALEIAEVASARDEKAHRRRELIAVAQTLS